MNGWIIAGIIFVISSCYLFMLCLCQAAKRADEVMAEFAISRKKEASHVKQT